MALWGCDCPQCPQCHPVRLCLARGALHTWESGAVRQGCHKAPRYPGTVTPATTGCHLCGLKAAGTAGASCSIPSASLSHPGSHRQSGPADRQHALPAPQAAEGTHGGRARPQRPPPPARLQGGLAAGPAQGRDADGCQRVPPPPRQGCLWCGGSQRGGSIWGEPGGFVLVGSCGAGRQEVGTSRSRDVTPLSCSSQVCSTTPGTAMKILATASWCPSTRPAPTPRPTACACSGCCRACSSAAPASTSSCSTCAAKGDPALATSPGTSCRARRSQHKGARGCWFLGERSGASP